MKEFIKDKMILLLTAAMALSFAGCSMFSNDESVAETEKSESKTDRYIETTKTGRYAIDADGADEEMTGFTTTTEEVAGTLENPVPDEPDPDIIATTTTTWYTTTKTTTTKKTTQKKTTPKKTTANTKTTKETSLVSDKLHAPTDAERFSGKKKYKVTSDTTYLNLRFGPSKQYEVQLKIPDGEIIYGSAKTVTGNDGWIYVTYKGTSGWVMEELLSAE